MKDIFGRELTTSTGIGDAEDHYEWTVGDNWEVTENTPMANQPTRFKIPLMPYQLASIHAMIQMETYKCFLTMSREIYSSAAKLSNDMGSGKTPTIIGLIASNPVPCNGPMYPISIDHYSNVATKGSGGAPRGVITRSYSRVYKPALIFVGYGVVNQWNGEVAKFTGYTHESAALANTVRERDGLPPVVASPDAMRVFTVDGIAALKRFYELVHNTTKHGINSYDIVIIKNKDVTGQWEWKHDELEEGIIDRKGARKIWNMVAVMCRNMCFTRLVVDDFDTIGVPPIAGNINALMTWFVSSTQANISSRVWHNTEHINIQSLIHNNNWIFSKITQNLILHDLFNVHVQSDYIKKFMSVGRPRFYYYKFENTVGRVMDFIGCMSGDKIGEIMEALNGDAVGEAARLAGIEANDPNQIFKALLNQNYDRLAEAKEVLTHFDEYFDTLDIDSLPPYSDNPNNEGEDRDTYTRKDVRCRRPLEWRYPGIRQILDEERKKWTDQFNECSTCLEKFKASVRSNECTVCSCELDDPDENYAIMPCCNELLHADCAVQGCAFVKEHTRDGIVIVGRCPFDKSHRVMFDKMTYIKGTFDLTKIDENKILDRVEDDDDNPDEPENDDKTSRTKYDAIIDIVRGYTPKEQVPINLHIAKVMQGHKHLGDPESIAAATRVRADMAAAGISDAVANELMVSLFPKWTPRSLIFASFDETLVKIEQSLKDNDVRYMRLGGTMGEMRAQIDAFWTNTIDVLLIKSTTHCSSLNLQCADNLIFAHQIQDVNIMTQVLGRIQRAGRTTDSRVHWMLFENEVSSLDPYKTD